MFRLILELSVKLIPIYLYAVLGFIIGKIIRFPKDKVADLLVYFIVPVVVFHGAYTIELSARVLLLPLIMLVLCTLIAFIFLITGRKIYKDNTPNLLGFCSAYGNFGYFAVPASIILFGPEAESLAIVAGLGFNIFLSTIGYYMTALGNFSIKESLIKTLKLPILYAILLGFALNYFNCRLTVFNGVDTNAVYLGAIRDIRGIFTVFGMMLLGLAIAELKELQIDWKFVLLSMVSHFVLWPLLVSGLIIADRQIFHLFPVIVHRIMFLMSVVPLGVNGIAVATQLDVQPQKAAVAILISTIFGMIYIPVILTIFASYI